MNVELAQCEYYHFSPPICMRLSSSILRVSRCTWGTGNGILCINSNPSCKSRSTGGVSKSPNIPSKRTSYFHSRSKKFTLLLLIKRSYYLPKHLSYLESSIFISLNLSVLVLKFSQVSTNFAYIYLLLSLFVLEILWIFISCYLTVLSLQFIIRPNLIYTYIINQLARV